MRRQLSFTHLVRLCNMQRAGPGGLGIKESQGASAPLPGEQGQVGRGREWPPAWQGSVSCRDCGHPLLGKQAVQGPARRETLMVPGPWPLLRDDRGGCAPPVRTVMLETLGGPYPPVIWDARPSPHIPKWKGADWQAEQALELWNRSCQAGEAVLAEP